MADNVFYVYGHYTKDTNELFYIGKGKGARCNIKYDRSKIWKEKIKAHGGFKVEILENNLTESAAYELEKIKIEEYRNNGINLVNITDGGSGPPILKGEDNPFFGKTHTQETRDRISRAKSRENHQFFGKKHPKEVIEKMSLRKRGKKFSEEHKLKLSKSHKGNKPSDETRIKLSLATKESWIKRKQLKEQLKQVSI